MPRVFACMDDLMFLSKIMEAAKALSLPFRSLKSVDKLIAACREGEEALVFLDLDDRRLDAIEFARALRAADPEPTATIYAFVSHVNEERVEEAGTGLFDRIFSRGQFVRALPELLAPPSRSA